MSASRKVDIGRKLDKANVLLSTLILDNKSGFNDVKIGLNNLTTMMFEHNTRLEAILETG